MLVTKRNGSLQELDITKIHAVLSWACDGYADKTLAPIRGVSVSQIEMQAQLHFYDKMPTKQIHSILIKAASDLISEDTPNYDQVAARLSWFYVRKEAFGSNIPPEVSDVLLKNIKLGKYTEDFLKLYSQEDLKILDSIVDHSRDDLIKFAGSVQLFTKYVVQDRHTGKIYESFQFPYILQSALLFADYPQDIRMRYVKDFYDASSKHEISLPTPIMAGLRTPEKQFSSCTLILSDDDLDSITETATAIVKYASAKAGIGIDATRIRAVGQPIRGGKAVSTGVIPFLKFFNGALKSCSQGAVRGASATVNLLGWHYEFESLVELKNEKGTEETRLRTMDYCFHLNRVFYERWASKGVISLFSPEEVPDLYNAFYSSDIDMFRRIYERCESNPSLRKKTISAEDYFHKLLSERFETNRIYIFHADIVNTQTNFYEPLTLTNLCTEITLPGRVLTKNPEQGRIPLCTLAANNMGKYNLLDTQEERDRLRKNCRLLVRGLDELLSYQGYPRTEAHLAVLDYRPLGIGVIGFAHWLAKNFLRWEDERTLEMVDKFMEHMSFYLIEASMELAKEKGPCLERTRFHDGHLPMDSSPLPPAKLHCDWEKLRADLRKYGIRNATLTAFMPSETSSQVSNETNGVEPPRSLVTAKGSKNGAPTQVVPEIDKLGHVYQTAWEVKTEDYLKVMARFQRWICQSISANTTYNPASYPNGLSLKDVGEDLLLAHSLGIKTLYYNNCNDSYTETTSDSGCESGACKL